MDTLIKLTLIGYTASFSTNRGKSKEEFDTDEWYRDFNFYPEGDNNAFDFKETDNIKGKFDFDSNIKLFIELPSNGDYKEIIPGETIKINNTYSDEECFAAGTYDLVVEYNNQRCIKHFFVDSKQLRYKNVNNLRNYVNGFYNLLSYDLTRIRKTWISYDGEPGYGQNFFTNYSFINVNYPKIMNYISRKINDSHNDLIKKEVISNKPSNLNQKSIRWLLEKGFTKNKDIKHPDYVLTKKSFFALDNEDNRIFKTHVEFWNEQLKNISDSISLYITGYSNIVNIEKQKIEIYKNKINDDKENYYIDKKEIWNLEGKIEDSNKIIERDSILIDEYKRKLPDINKYQKYTSYILNGTWLRNIKADQNYLNKLTKDKILIILNEFKDRYLGQKNKNSNVGVERVEYFAQKNTPKLFETYIYILLINIARSLGFEMANGYSKQDMISHLSNESITILQNKEGEILEIHYDEYLDAFSFHNVSNGFCSINSNHNKPDFIVGIKDKDGNLLNSIVFEAKWRSFKSIYNEKGNTPVMLNLIDYLSLGYSKIENDRAKLIRSPISKVVVLYPDSEEKQTELLNDYIYSYSLSISDDIEKSEGYNYIKNLIKEMI